MTRVRKLTEQSKFTFIDLFAGIGGFHAALSEMGGECVYAVEIDPKAAAIYELNWGINPLGDITEVANDDRVDIPDHDVLVAGFPCQPFSKSGFQRGMSDTRGTLYWNILKIIEVKKPAFVLLENVRNLAGPKHTHEWNIIISTLRDQGYKVSSDPVIVSPHKIPPHLGGTPQSRDRVFIAAVRADGISDLSDISFLNNYNFEDWSPQNWNLCSDLPLLSKEDVEDFILNDNEIFWLEAWNELIVGIKDSLDGNNLPSFPIWDDSWIMPDDLDIPENTPKWKASFLIKNAEFYAQHRWIIDEWISRWDFYSDKFPASRRKLEWQAQDADSIFDTCIQFRPSGIRVKKQTYLPALVAITQTSIIGSQMRRLSVREAARLQGFPESFDFGDQLHSASYKQLGNSVCVGAVSFVFKKAVDHYSDILKNTCPSMI